MKAHISSQLKKNISQNISNKIEEITTEQLEKTLYNELSKDQFLKLIKISMEEFLNAVKEYEKKNNAFSKNLDILKKQLDEKVEIIYSKFFAFQNIINAYLGQKIVMTYVHIDSDGNREIRISENNIEHLVTTQGFSRGKSFAKISYDVQEHYQKLKNSLPDEEQQSIQDAAKEVTLRYQKFKRQVLWYHNNNWIGYKFTRGNLGPINEAFVNFYVNKQKLNGYLEQKINRFMLDSKYGAINADATKGFMIGDVERNGIQYAVKGAFGSPQGYKQVANEIRKAKLDIQFNEQNLNVFIEKFTTEEKNKNYKPQISRMSSKEVEKVMDGLSLIPNTIGLTL